MAPAAGSWLLLVLMALASVGDALLPPLPMSGAETFNRAAKSIAAASAAGKRRQLVKIVIPLPPETKEEDIDPWPGGLSQMYTEVTPAVKDMLQKATGSNSGVDTTEQVLDASDVVGLFVCEGATATEDVACVLFPSCDTLQKLADVDKMVGPRTLVLMNSQYNRVEDFSLWQKGKAKEVFFERKEGLYETSFALEEFLCRGEDVKLVCDYVEDKGQLWSCYAIIDNKPLPLTEERLPARPEYKFLESRINELVPEVAWKRKMNEAGADGPRFLR